MSQFTFVRPQSTFQKDALEESTIKILLATDNHIGYLERDPVRGRDSFDSFEEILKLAVKREVDFILLAGDLFHENRPSRDCIYRVVALLREYTLGDKPVELELLSDAAEGKAAGFSFPAVNYEDPNFNVSIPVFSIHGNHDDPQGAGPEGALCALDLLSVTGLLNYMGKIDLPTSADIDPSNPDSTGIVVRPVLVRKGNTRLGMYGVGNVKDARMHYELRSNRVKMYMPKDKDQWFNIMLVHQNRVKRGPQEAVPEGMFDDNVDLVVWGHEHDCRIVPESVAGKNYFITQPGSSVATSLADGESLEKHVALLQIQGKDFSMEPIPLRTVRPFVIDEVCLLDAAEDEDFDVTDQIVVGKFLRGKVNELIEKANAQWEERNAKALERGEEPLPSMLPLIRLKVDTTGVSELSNPIRFGQEFQGRVANPRDLLIFHRAKKSFSRKGRGANAMVDEPELSIDDPNISTSEKLNKIRVGSLVREYLASQEMQLLGESGMADAIQTYVDKDDPHAIQNYVNLNLKSLMKDVQSKGQVEEDDLDDVVLKAKKTYEDNYEEHAKEMKSKKKGKAKAPASDAESMDSMMELDADPEADEDDDFNGGKPAPQKRGTTGRATAATKGKGKAAATKATTARGKGKKAATPSSDDEIIPIDEDEDEPAPAPVKKTNRAAVLSQPSAATKKAPARSKAAGASSSTQNKKQATLNFAPSQRSTRAAASTAKRKVQKVVELDSDEDDE
ncbi:DNA repair exonuclease [Schizopora paradoxa]|uniref:Double-strand break repair protein n=1 Tax=Schizopora paradoxa TaxID=27342 RepID=A0A0H2RVC3_9AGAM|nr:DNA repair exonuclease [Schizopora paradoxa]